jgi:urease accessory protein
MGCLPLIDDLVARAAPDNAMLSSFLPFLEIAAARHERADLRLFAN